jgi:hypothetical protein
VEAGLNEVSLMRAENARDEDERGDAMTNDNGSERQDQVWPMAVQWDLGVGGQYRDVLWQCDAMRAGRLYQRSLFGTQAEAEEFVAKLRENEPDQMFRVEAIKASAVWN